MRMFHALAPLATLTVLLAGCGKEGAESGAATPQSAPTPATLDGKSGLPETWTVEDAAVPLLFFTQLGMKLSASCKKADGTLDCAAFQYVKNGMPTEIAKRELDGRASPGSKVCLKMNNQVVNGKNSVGSTETFCKFPDGSLITVGTLEQYSLRIVQ
jgi:putative hemolysin